jgi:large conductance mechanosensitive channel
MAREVVQDDGTVIPAVTMNLGNFLQATVDFVIVAFAIFMFIKAINSFQKKKEDPAPSAPPAPSKEELLLTEIRDLLKEKK